MPTSRSERRCTVTLYGPRPQTQYRQVMGELVWAFAIFIMCALMVIGCIAGMEQSQREQCGERLRDCEGGARYRNA